MWSGEITTSTVRSQARATVDTMVLLATLVAVQGGNHGPEQEFRSLWHIGVCSCRY